MPVGVPMFRGPTPAACSKAAGSAFAGNLLTKVTCEPHGAATLAALSMVSGCAGVAQATCFHGHRTRTQLRLPVSGVNEQHTCAN